MKSWVEARPRRVVERCREVLAESGQGVAGARVLVVGVAYKPNVEDVRESPAIEIIEELLELGAHVGYHDPHTAHAGLELDWVDGAAAVLDTTYRMTDLPRRAVV